MTKFSLSCKILEGGESTGQIRDMGRHQAIKYDQLEFLAEPPLLRPTPCSISQGLLMREIIPQILDDRLLQNIVLSHPGRAYESVFYRKRCRKSLLQSCLNNEKKEKGSDIPLLFPMFFLFSVTSHKIHSCTVNEEIKRFGHTVLTLSSFFLRFFISCQNIENRNHDNRGSQLKLCSLNREIFQDLDTPVASIYFSIDLSTIR